MKRVNGVYEQMCSKPLLKQAIINAAKHKKKRGQVIQVLKNIDKYVNILQRMLVEDTYKPSPFRAEIIHCPEKDRLIKKSPFFPDRCIHHAIALVMLPKWDKAISHHTFASWKGRGINAKNREYNINHRVKRTIARCPIHTKLYCFKFDIKKCYENIDNDVLDIVLAQHCKDKRMLRLMHRINHSDKGLPIGSYLSQLWVNLYLTPLDKFVIQIMSEYNCYIDYARYMDDGVIFCDDKKVLNKIKHRMENFLHYVLHQRLNKKSQLFLVGNDKYHRSVDLCGYKFYREYTNIRNRIKNNIKEHKKDTSLKALRGMASYKGLLLSCESINLLHSLGYDSFQQLNFKEDSQAI